MAAFVGTQTLIVRVALLKGALALSSALTALAPLPSYVRDSLQDGHDALRAGVRRALPSHAAEASRALCDRPPAPRRRVIFVVERLEVAFEVVAEERGVAAVVGGERDRHVGGTLDVTRRPPGMPLVVCCGEGRGRVRG